jgi:hypothetical protein
VIAGAVLEALSDAPLTLDGHHLANLRFIVADVRREADGRTYHGIVRLRALTEPVCAPRHPAERPRSGRSGSHETQNSLGVHGFRVSRRFARGPDDKLGETTCPPRKARTCCSRWTTATAS